MTTEDVSETDRDPCGRLFIGSAAEGGTNAASSPAGHRKGKKNKLR